MSPDPGPRTSEVASILRRAGKIVIVVVVVAVLAIAITVNYHSSRKGNSTATNTANSSRTLSDFQACVFYQKISTDINNGTTPPVAETEALMALSNQVSSGMLRTGIKEMQTAFSEPDVATFKVYMATALAEMQTGCQ